MKKLAILSVLLLAFAATSFATVTFDPNTGTGFVGKGDVQIAFGWNNQQVQANLPAVTFFYQNLTSYTAVCQWTTAEGKKGQKTHTISRSRTVGVSGSVTYDTRNNSKGMVTGITLNGFGNDYNEQGGIIPVIGDSCPGEGTDGQWISVDITSSSNGLFVLYPTLPTVKIWPPLI